MIPVFEMLEDRNRTSHQYSVLMAEQVFSHIRAYHALMVRVTKSL